MYDVILSHGVLHLPKKEIRDAFIERMQNSTAIGGLNLVSIFTNRLPATPDNAPFTRSLFFVGELPEKYADWDIISHTEGTFFDSHPGNETTHQHAYEKVVAKRKK